MANGDFIARLGIKSQGGVVFPITLTTSDYTVQQTDFTIDVISGATQVLLISAVSDGAGKSVKGKILVIKNSSQVSISVVPNGSEKINGQSSLTLVSNESIQIQSDGSNWIIFGGYGTSGSSGSSGTSGSSGSSGTSGSSGSSGTSGTSGSSGSSGSSGTSGSSGSSGTSGSSGSSGSSGTSGSSGSSGTSGTSGSSGNSNYAGKVSNSSFTGSPLTYTVTLSSSFPNTNYSVVVTGGDARTWTIESQTTSGFIINSNSNTSLSYSTYWMATLNN